MVRWILIGAGLVFVAVSALLLAMDKIVFWLVPITWVGRYEIFHIIAHIVIFGCVMLVAYPHKIGWIFVIIGGLAIEMSQVVGRGGVIDMSRVGASLYDMIVDMAGAAAGWLWAAYLPRRWFYIRR